MRLSFRNAINSGLPVIELAEGTEVIETGDEIGIDFTAGTVEHNGKTYTFSPLPPEVLAILEDGGLIPHVKKVSARIAQRGPVVSGAPGRVLQLAIQVQLLE